MKTAVSKMAETLVNYSLEVRKGELAVIYADVACIELVRECSREILRAGAHPYVVFSDAVSDEIFYRTSSDEQLKYISPFSRILAEAPDCILTIKGTSNTAALSGIDPKRISARTAASREVIAARKRRTDSGEMRWTLTEFPTDAGAQNAGMSLSDYQDFVYGACMLYEQDTVKAWTELSRKQQAIADYLNTKSTIRFLTPSSDISMSFRGRKWVNSDGRHNFPSGEVYTSPEDGSAQGHILFTYPLMYMGRAVENVRLVFRNGEVTEYSADAGEDILDEIINLDEGSRRLGEAAIGTNYSIKKFIKNMLFDEKIGGTVHLALGSAYADAGGINMSSVHVDMLCDMTDRGKIFTDDELIYENGYFKFFSI